MSSRQRGWQDWLADLLEVGLDRLVLLLLAVVALYPTILALLYLVAPQNPSVSLQLWDLLWFSDAGGQMGLGPGFLRAAVLVAGAIWLIKLRDLPNSARPWLAMAALYYVVAFASAVTSSHPHDALLAWVDQLNVGLMVCMAADLSSQHPWLLARAPYAAVVLALAVIPANYKQFLFEPAADEQMRGAFFHPNIMASYLVLFMPVLLAMFLRDDGPELAPGATLLFGISTAFALGSIILSFSRAGQLVGVAAILGVLILQPACSWRRLLARAALVALAGMLGMVGLLKGFAGQSGMLVLGGALMLVTIFWLLRAWEHPRVASLRMVGLILLVAIMLGGMDLGQGKVTERATSRAQNLAQGKDNSFLARLAFWKAAWEIALDHPRLGVGPAGFQRYYPSYQQDLNWFSKFAHNLPLTILSETGFPAFFVATCLALGLGLVLGRRLVTASPSARRDTRVGLVVGVGAFLLYSCSDVQFEFRLLPLTMAMLLGLALGSPDDEHFPVEDVASEQEPLSAWTIRPQVLMQHTLCVFLMALTFFDFVASLGDERARYGKAANEIGKVKEAAIFYREALSVDPWQGEHLRQCCLALVSAGLQDEKQKKEALRMAEQVVLLDSHRAVGFNLLGRVSLQAGQPEAARAAFRRALEIDPINYPSFYIDLATMLLGQDEEEARLLLLATVQRFPEETFATMFDFRAKSIRTQLADAYMLLGDLSNPVQNPRVAEPYFTKAVALNERSRLALFGLAVALYHQDRDAEALTRVEALRALAPDYEPGLTLAEELYRQLGKAKEAEAVRKHLDELAAGRERDKSSK